MIIETSLGESNYALPKNFYNPQKFPKLNNISIFKIFLTAENVIFE